MDEIDAFNYVTDIELEDPNGIIAGLNDLRRIAAMQIGSGDRAFHGDQDGIWAGAERIADAPFSVDMDGNLLANSATISGSITATTGSIGGFSIGADYIRDAANSFGLSSTTTVGDDIRFWAGDTFANRAIAPFRVSESGVVSASNLTITGGSISGASIDIGGADSTSFHVATNGEFWMGNATFSGAPFRSSAAGVVDVVEIHFGNNGSSNYFASDSSLNMTADIVLSTGASLTWNGGDISGNMPSFSMGADIAANGHAMNGISYLQFNTNSNQSGDGTLWLFASGASRFWRSRANGFNGQFDQVGF